MNNPVLKRGWAKHFEGENWKLVKDSGWSDHRLYVPNGMEIYCGVRTFDGIDYSVFRCLDDSFLAQIMNVCASPRSTDDMEIESVAPYELKPIVREERISKRPETIQVQMNKQKPVKVIRKVKTKTIISPVSCEMVPVIKTIEAPILTELDQMDD